MAILVTCSLTLGCDDSKDTDGSGSESASTTSTDEVSGPSGTTDQIGSDTGETGENDCGFATISSTSENCEIRYECSDAFNQIECDVFGICTCYANGQPTGTCEYMNVCSVVQDFEKFPPGFTEECCGFQPPFGR
ncbi:MAG: hypothetical protein ACPG4T_03470 [Nannocystaceae bacterium]